MSKEIYISSTPHETRLAIVEKDELTEIYYERENEYTLAGSIYNGKVTRVLPGMQSSFVDIGLERDAFLYITDFMEEQGDTADFDSGEARNGRRDNRDRNRPRREEKGHGEDTGEQNGSASAHLADEEEAQTRPERNGGSRDRHRVGNTGREGGPEARPARAFAGEVSTDVLDMGSADAPGDEELGEGAPGADGSRRWRGRRGRRRGRGPGDASSGAALASPQAETEPDLSEEGVAESLRAGAAEPQHEVESQDARTDFQAQESSAVERPGGSVSGDRPGRGERRDAASQFGGPERRRDDRRRDDRGGRFGNGRGRGGERPSRSGSREAGVYAEAVDDRAETAAPAEPFILPGESLSKYRKGDDGAPAPAESSTVRTPANVVMARPSTEIELPSAWDGGATLPGESLSRYSQRESRQERPGTPSSSSPTETHQPSQAAEPFRSEAAVGQGRRRERDLRRGRVSQLSAADAVQPGIASFHTPEETALPPDDDGSAREAQPVDDITVAAFEEVESETVVSEVSASSDHASFRESFEASAQDISYEPQTDLAPPATETPSALLEAVEEFHEVVSEFEPGDNASASYRVDPVGPSEFRQSVPDADVLVDVRFDENDPIAQEGANHEFTAVQPTGEMISEWPLTPEAEAVRNEDASTETTPVAHEKAVQSVRLEEAEAPVQSAQIFNPGDGQLEEELLDDEDGELPQLQGSFNSEDTEEETLSAHSEAGSGSQPESGTELHADLGSFIRDMSIDDLTSSQAALEDEDDDFDLDEDELEEDELEEDELAAGKDDASPADFGEFKEFTEYSEAEEMGLEGDSEAHADEHFAAPTGEAAPTREGDRTERREERRDGRRGGRDRGRGERRGASTGGRPGGHHGNGRMTRHQAQTSDLPAISDLLKPGQEVLVQIAKEPIAKKGARITSHIALPGRFLVFMPTVQHVGVSRKIESDSERRRLKEILLSERGEASGGFIVRTAASGASEEELRSDLRFLLNLWADIKQRSESSKSPALIYHDLNLVERILRDQVTDTFSAIWVDTETEYERVLRFLQRFQPSLIRRVKLYTKETPLFEQFGISEEINKALRSKVWLKSGGSIVINQTEALVAIDINTGKYVGKTARLEDTIVKTNLDAIPEIVRQIRLRDLGGIIVIDFIDMDERRNRAKVLAVLEEELKKDRAPSKVLQFNDFGLVAITRKRVKQSLERTLSQTCNTCAGTGMVKSPITVCNEIFIEFRKMHKHLDKGDVMLRVNPEVVKQLKSNGGKWLQEMEEVAGKTILVKSDPSLHPEQFDIQ